jgi:hypothetical protein
MDVTHVLEQAAVVIEPGGRRPFARTTSATMLLTPDELLVVGGPPEAPHVFMRQGRGDLAMVRRPAPRGGERVELEAIDGQQATLRFGRAEAASAQALAGWLAGLPPRG